MIQYSIGVTKEGEFVFANNASKEIKYYCLTCKDEFILKQGEIRIAHFAHKTLIDANCNPESQLHIYIKTRFAEILKQKIKENKEIIFSWKCEKYPRGCEKEHRYVAENIKNVNLEYRMGNCIPDIALLDENNKVVVVLEIVVTHKPEAKTLEYYKENNILCMQYIVKKKDCLLIEKEINLNDYLFSPNKVNKCFSPIVKENEKSVSSCKYKEYLLKESEEEIEEEEEEEIKGYPENCEGQQKKIKIYKTICDWCYKVINVAFGEFMGYGFLPEDFSQDEINQLKQYDVFIKKSDNFQIAKKVFITVHNRCKYCNTLIMNAYLSGPVFKYPSVLIKTLISENQQVPKTKIIAYSYGHKKKRAYLYGHKKEIG